MFHIPCRIVAIIEKSVKSRTSGNGMLGVLHLTLWLKGAQLLMQQVDNTPWPARDMPHKLKYATEQPLHRGFN